MVRVDRPDIDRAPVAAVRHRAAEQRPQRGDRVEPLMRKDRAVHGVPAPVRRVGPSRRVSSATASCSAAVTASSHVSRFAVRTSSHHGLSFAASVWTRKRVTNVKRLLVVLRDRRAELVAGERRRQPEKPRFENRRRRCCRPRIEVPGSQERRRPADRAPRVRVRTRRAGVAAASGRAAKTCHAESLRNRRARTAALRRCLLPQRSVMRCARYGSGHSRPSR